MTYPLATNSARMEAAARPPVEGLWHFLMGALSDIERSEQTI
jgi:hypothetical protein